jgi:hypothetical protein
MADADPTPPENTPPADAKGEAKKLFREVLDEWANDREKTRTETGSKPKGLLEGLLGF